MYVKRLSLSGTSDVAVLVFGHLLLCIRLYVGVDHGWGRSRDMVHAGMHVMRTTPPEAHVSGICTAS
jgi:hypothetical protein